MIHREDMLELTRRMNLQRNCFSRVAGAYVDADGEIDGTFNTHFLKLPVAERNHCLSLAKAIPFAEPERFLFEYRFPKESRGQGSMWQLLMALKQCELKNDALLQIFYEVAAETFHVENPYYIYLFYGAYDVPRKGSDKTEQWESEEVYPFLICSIGSMSGEYEAGEAHSGFLFPLFRDRSGDPERTAIFRDGYYYGNQVMLSNLLKVERSKY